MSEPVIPTVNLNGTDGKVLLDSYVHAMTNAEKLEEELSKIFPHGRDYQLAPDTYAEAKDQFHGVLQKIHDVKKYLETIAVGINRQIER